MTKISCETFRCCVAGCDSSATSATGYQTLVMLGWRVDDVSAAPGRLFHCPRHYPLGEEEHLSQLRGVTNTMRVLAAVGDGPLHNDEVARLMKEAIFIVSVHPVLSTTLKFH